MKNTHMYVSSFSHLKANVMSHPFVSRRALNIKSYQSILQINPSAPSVNLTSFYRDIYGKAKEKFNIPHHAKISPTTSIRAVYLYDAVLVYAEAATKVIKSGGDLRNGRQLMQKYVFNQKFTSKQGFQVNCQIFDRHKHLSHNFFIVVSFIGLY
jgi:ABC-type branched-subunit amino acid transport system substrate-binding protein